MADTTVDLSLVIPLYNEEEVFAELLRRLCEFVNTLQTAPNNQARTVEVILIDDGSHDATPRLIQEASATHSWIRGVIFSRNFGHQIAVTAGMQHTSGRAVAILDGDLQDPPEVILEFLQKMRAGYDVVYAIRTKRKENILKRAAYAAFYRIMRALSTIPIPLDSGDFCLMSRRVVDEVNTMPERHRFIRGMRSWVGYQQIGHSYPRAARTMGESKYSFSKLLKLAFDGIFTFSEKPLQWSTMMGMIVAAGSFLWGTFVILWRIFGVPSSSIQGWATLAVGIMFLGGVQLISIGILGEYIGRIHNEVKGRPMYVVKERCGFPQEAENSLAKVTQVMRGVAQ